MKKRKVSEGKTAVVYTRYSTGSNLTEQSIEDQIRDCDKYANENGIKICDSHISGKKDSNRSKFQQMLQGSPEGVFFIKR